jgi:hypothetical protein
MRKRLYVNSNDRATPRITLTIQAKIELKVAWEPKRLELSLKAEAAKGLQADAHSPRYMTRPYIPETYSQLFASELVDYIPDHPGQINSRTS